jgi:hypothetical protein
MAASAMPDQHQQQKLREAKTACHWYGDEMLSKVIAPLSRRGVAKMLAEAPAVARDLGTPSKNRLTER